MIKTDKPKVNQLNKSLHPQEILGRMLIMRDINNIGVELFKRLPYANMLERILIRNEQGNYIAFNWEYLLFYADDRELGLIMSNFQKKPKEIEHTATTEKKKKKGLFDLNLK